MPPAADVRDLRLTLWSPRRAQPGDPCPEPQPRSPAPPHTPPPSGGSPAETFPESSLDSTPISGSASGKPDQDRSSSRNLFMIQFRSVAQSCLTLCDLMNRSTSGIPVHHQLPEFTQTHVHGIDDPIQPSHPLSSPSPPAPNPSQHQGLFQPPILPSIRVFSNESTL